MLGSEDKGLAAFATAQTALNLAGSASNCILVVRKFRLKEAFDGYLIVAKSKGQCLAERNAY